MEQHQQNYYLSTMGIQRWMERGKVPVVGQSVAQVPRPASGLPLKETQTPIQTDHGQLDWSQLEQAVAACTACRLHTSRTQTVFGVGNTEADLLIVGEAPGANEDLQGLPFVGRGGQLLDKMLNAIGLDREEVYIANVLKCRPPNNRDPLGSEVATCTPFLERQVALLQPKLILAVGRYAAHYLLDTTQSLSRLRGKQYKFRNTGVPLIVSYHPAYLLRNPTDKRKSYEDLLLVKQVLAGD